MTGMQTAVCLRSVHLFAGSPVNGYHRSACRFAHPCYFHSVDAACVPALANFDGDGNIDSLHHRFHNPAAECGILHQCAAAVVPGDLWCGTPHIDVNCCGRMLCGDFCRFRHYVRLIAEKLQCHGTFRFRDGKQRSGLAVAHDEPLGADHFACAISGAEAHAQFAEGAVGDSCHWGENRLAFDFSVSEFHSIITVLGVINFEYDGHIRP